nr:transport-associated domain protein [uncultured bacterium]
MSTLYEAERIAEVAAGRLKTSPYAAVRRVTCVYDEGVLILQGDVPTYYQKQLAQSAVTGLATAARIANRIRVRDVRKDERA